MIELAVTGLGFQPVWEMALAHPVAVAAPLPQPFVEADLAETAYIGLGSHEVKVNLTSALAQLGVTAEEIFVRVQHPDESITEYRASATPAAAYAAGTFETQVFTEEYTTASCDIEDHTFITFWHDFCAPGEYRASLGLTFGGGLQVTAPEAIKLFAGDGLFGD